MVKQLTIKTQQQKQVVDLTDTINGLIKKESIEEGICHLTVLHTTCCLTTADLDPGTDQDMIEAINKIFPEGNYRHPHNPQHVGDHIMSSIIGPNINLPIEDKALMVGTWQRVVLIELSGPRDRQLIYQFEKI